MDTPRIIKLELSPEPTPTKPKTSPVGNRLQEFAFKEEDLEKPPVGNRLQEFAFDEDVVEIPRSQFAYPMLDPPVPEGVHLQRIRSTVKSEPEVDKSNANWLDKFAFNEDALNVHINE